jgi:hypothetical protein
MRNTAPDTDAPDTGAPVRSPAPIHQPIGVWWRARLAFAGRWYRWAWPAGFAVAGIGLFFAYLRLSETVAVNSDGASQALQAWDMLHGNVLLRGWTLSDVSFYTTELPEYMLVELVRGLRPDVVHIAAALTYTLMVLFAAQLARGRATGGEAVVRALAGPAAVLPHR